jgi:hypothetical protein
MTTKKHAARRRAAPRRRRFLRWRSLLAVPALVAFLLGVSLAGAALTPGNHSATAPAKGGRPKGLNQVPATVTSAPTSTLGPSPAIASSQAAPGVPSTTVAPSTTTAPPGLASPTAVPLVVQPALPGEGQWQATGPLVDGVPAMMLSTKAGN